MRCAACKSCEYCSKKAKKWVMCKPHQEPYEEYRYPRHYCSKYNMDCLDVRYCNSYKERKTMLIKECKKCGSKNLVLQQPRPDGQVALVCADCGAWIKWCPKEERKFYPEQELAASNKEDNFAEQIIKKVVDGLKDMNRAPSQYKPRIEYDQEKSMFFLYDGAGDIWTASKEITTEILEDLINLTKEE